MFAPGVLKNVNLFLDILACTWGVICWFPTTWGKLGSPYLWKLPHEEIPT